MDHNASTFILMLPLKPGSQVNQLLDDSQLHNNVAWRFQKGLEILKEKRVLVQAADRVRDPVLWSES